ncbi:MAG TPA: hypothetical protein VEW74_01910 [Candidatus Nitrosotalea sp.]|nr:hypothetical protein [Candidatus Nitrosotalea sp.]
MIRAPIRFLSGIAFAGVLLAGCGEAQSSLAPVATTVLGGETQSRPPSKTQREDLLYVSNSANGDVAVYTFPKRQFVTTLSALNTYGSGECTDAAGNIFITTFNQYGASTIYEFAHGGTTPIATLADQGQALGCAVDPTTGNLAVTNVVDHSPSNPYPYNSDLAIYTGAQGYPQMYYDSSPEFPNFGFCGYDNQGNLYLSTTDASNPGTGALLHFTGGSNPLSAVSVNAPIYGALSVQWDGTYMTIGSAADKAGHGPISVYRLTISGSSATVVGTTVLIGMKKAAQSWILGQNIVGANGVKKTARDISFWHYPAGGTHHQFIKNVGSSLFGVTISKPSR